MHQTPLDSKAGGHEECLHVSNACVAQVARIRIEAMLEPSEHYMEGLSVSANVLVLRRMLWRRRRVSAQTQWRRRSR